VPLFVRGKPENKRMREEPTMAFTGEHTAVRDVAYGASKQGGQMLTQQSGMFSMVLTVG
jgi:hypothetical protein